MGRPQHIGIALGAGVMHAVRAGAARSGAERPVWTRAVDPASAEDLTAAFSELRASMHLQAPIAHLALLPPLAQVRRLKLPRLRDDELRRVLERDASRMFLVGREPQVAGARWIRGGRRGAQFVFAAAAPAGTIEALYAAATASGWRIAAVVPAAAAWCAGAAQEQPGLRAGAVVEVDCGDHIEILAMERGAPVAVRRVARGVDASQAVAGLRELLGGDAPVGSSTAPGRDPAVTAAFFASRAISPELAPATEHAARRGSARRLTIRLATAAAALLIASAAFELWGAHREIAAIDARRAALHRDVAAALRARDAVNALDTRLTTLSSLERTSPRWSAALFTVAEHLPRDAHISVMRGAADSLVLEGEAQTAAGVFESIRGAPGVRAVRADAPIRQETRESGATVERFTLAAHLRADSAGRGAP
jgi:hypothetical protein